jgi:hypothetical protein
MGCGLIDVMAAMVRVKSLLRIITRRHTHTQQKEQNRVAKLLNWTQLTIRAVLRSLKAIRPNGTVVPSWKGGDIVTPLLKKYGKYDLLAYMNKYWKSRNEPGKCDGMVGARLRRWCDLTGADLRLGFVAAR